MRIKFTGCLGVLALGLAVSMATACPGEGQTVKKDAVSAKKVTTVADKTNDGTAKASTKPCCGKKAKLAAKTVENKAKGGCAKHCSKSDNAKKVTTVADKVKANDGTAKASAEPCCGKKAKLAAEKGGCEGCDKPAALTAGDHDCPVGKKINAVLASLPAIQYRVGDEVTDCSKSAAAMAEKTGSTLQYVVGDETFAGEGEAMVKLTSLLEAEAEKMESLQFVAGGKSHACPYAAKSAAKAANTKLLYRVGGMDFDGKEQAEVVLAAVKEAADSVALKYKVDGKTYNCSKLAAEKCKETGAKLTYVIGDEETTCEISAKLKLARQRVRKIVETAVTKSFSL